MPLALSSSSAATEEEGTELPTPLSAVAAHLLVASSWRRRALPSILRALQKRKEREKEEEEREKEEEEEWPLALYGLLRHDVVCANLLAVALSAPPPSPAAAPPFDNNDSRRFSVTVLPPAIRALRDDSETACALAAWAARSVLWWDAGEGGRAAAARTLAAARTAAATKAACAGGFSCCSSFSPSLAADETALAAAASALAVFRCLAQHAEDLPPGVGAVLAWAGAGDLVPVLVSWRERERGIFREVFFLFFIFSLFLISSFS